MSSALCQSYGGGQFLMSEVPLYLVKRVGAAGLDKPFDLLVWHHLRHRKVMEYRGTSLMRKRPPLGPYMRAIPRALWWSCGRQVVGLIAASIYDKHSVGPSIRLICTRCCFRMTNVIQMCSNFH